MTQRICLPLFLGALGLLSSTARAGILPEGLVHETLDNGLEVVILPLDTPGLVAVQTWMDVGSRHEVVAGATGYAHFFEHLMFHGTPTLSGDERERKLVSMAVAENAWTSDDSTCYHLQAPAPQVGELLAMEADRFENLSLEAEGVRREAGAVLGEFRKGASDPEEQLYYALWDTAFQTHTYSHTPIGLEEDIHGMPEGMDTALAFFATHYRPDNAVLVVTGDLDPEATLATVRERYAGWAAPTDAPERQEPAEEPEQTELRREHIVWDGGSTSPLLSVGFKIPAYRVDDPEVAALVVARELLLSDVGRVRRRLVDEEGVAWSLWGGGPERVDPGLLEIHVQLREDAVIQDVEAMIAEEITEVRDAQDLEERVELVRERLRRQAVLGLGSPSSWGFALGWATQVGGSPQALETDLETLSAVDAEAVREAMKRYLRPTGLTVVSLSEGELEPAELDPWRFIRLPPQPDASEVSQ